MCLLLTGCVPASPQAPAATPAPAEPEGPGTLRWALGRDPTSLDPGRIVDDADALLADALFDSLTRLGPDLDAEPALATAWHRNADATTFTFDLDPEARWHDGTPVVAQDVVRGLRRVVDGSATTPSVHAGLLADVTGFAAARDGLPLRGVRAEGEHRVRIELQRPVPELPRILSHPGLAPVPAAAAEDPDAFGESPVGNGPFELAEPWAHNQFLRLAPSQTHPAPSNVDTVVFRIYASDEDREIRHSALLSGQIQVSQVPDGRRSEIAPDAPAQGEVSEIELLRGLTDTTSMLLFDTRNPLLGDVRVRRAISLLIDREGLALRTDGAREPADALVPPVLPGRRSRACAWCRHDPAGARVLLADVLAERAEAEQETPEIVVQTSDDALHATLANQLATSLRGAGMDARVVQSTPGDYLTTIDEEQSAVIRLGWSPDEPTLRAWTEQLFGAGSTGASLTGWQPAALGDLLERAAGSADHEVRAGLWQQVAQLALDEAVVAPVLFYRDDLLVASEVEGLRRDPFGNVDLTAVSVPGAGEG